MVFQYPAFLFALFAIAIPIIIHLFNFQKYKVVKFSNLQFLINIQSKTKRLSQFKRLLLLILRILFITFLALVFARPIIADKSQNLNATSANYLAIYIDNSQSMNGYNDEGKNLIDDAKNKAKDIVQQYGLSDKFMIITNELDGGSFRFLNRDDALNSIENISIENFSRSINDILKRINNEFSKIDGQSKHIIIISDFQKPLATFDENTIDKNTKLFLIPLNQKIKSNIYIDSCWFELPLVRGNQQLTLNVNIHNESSDYFEMIPINLRINNEDVSSVVTSLKSGESKVAQLNYIETKNGIRNGEIKIDDKGPFNFDDVFYFSYDIRNSVNVLELFDKNASPYIKALFNSDSIINFSNCSIKNIDYSSLNAYDMIIFSDASDIASGTISEIKKYISKGGVVLVIPSIDAKIESLNNFSMGLCQVEYSSIDTSKTQISELSNDFYLFRNVFEQIPEVADLPIVSKRFVLKNQANLIPIMKLLDGNIFLGNCKIDAGNLYFLTSSLNDRSGNFHRHALVVPTLLNMAFFAKKTNELYHIIGSNHDITLNNINQKIDEAIKLKGVNSKNEFIPSTRIQSNQVIITTYSQNINAGCYNIIESDNVICGLAFNQSPSESIMKFESENTLKILVDEKQFSNIKVIEDANKIHQSIEIELYKGLQLWKIFLILSIIVILIETMVLRFLNTTDRQK